MGESAAGVMGTWLAGHFLPWGFTWSRVVAQCVAIQLYEEDAAGMCHEPAAEHGGVPLNHGVLRWALCRSPDLLGHTLICSCPEFTTADACNHRDSRPHVGHTRAA